MKLEELVKWARVCATDDEDCDGCPFEHNDTLEDYCSDALLKALVERMETLAARTDALTDRCARYAEEIAVMQARERWISAEEALPEPPKEVE